MKITKNILKDIILEALGEEQPEATPQMGTREKKVAAATETGAMMDAEKYASILKQVLLSTKVAPQARKAALESIFGQKGSSINALILQMVKGA